MPLTNREHWRYFEDPGTPDDEAAAIALLRARLGTSYATTPDDATLSAILKRSVRLLERATQRFFVQRVGRLDLAGTGVGRLWLPFPVVSTDQGGTGVTEVVIDNGDPLEAASYDANDGAWEGPDDPREDPYLEWARTGPWSSLPSQPPRRELGGRTWPLGTKVVGVTASWGYLDEDGTTPEPILHALARLVILNTPALDDPGACADARAGAIVSETTQGRSYTYTDRVAGTGLTLDREIDSILRSYRRPPEAYVPNMRQAFPRARYLE